MIISKFFKKKNFDDFFNFQFIIKECDFLSYDYNFKKLL